MKKINVILLFWALLLKTIPAFNSDGAFFSPEQQEQTGTEETGAGGDANAKYLAVMAIQQPARPESIHTALSLITRNCKCRHQTHSEVLTPPPDKRRCACRGGFNTAKPLQYAVNHACKL